MVGQKKLRRNAVFDRPVKNFDGLILTVWYSVKKFLTEFFDGPAPRQEYFDDFFDGLIIRQKYTPTDFLTDEAIRQEIFGDNFLTDFSRKVRQNFWRTCPE